MDGRHGASFSSSSRGRPPPALARPPNPLPLPKTHCRRRLPVPKWREANAQGPPPPPCRECVHRPAVGGRAGGRINTPPAPPATARRTARPAAGTWGAPPPAAAGLWERGDWGGESGAGCGDGVVPAADGVRTREVEREMSPHRASLARRRRHHQHRRRHLHFCPSFSVSQAPLPSGGGGANGGRRPAGGSSAARGRGSGKRAARPFRLGGSTLSGHGAVRRERIGPFGPRGLAPSECSGEHVLGKAEAEGRVRPRG